MQIFPSINYGYSTYDPHKEIPNVEGKVILVTGANSGIGYQTAEVLASKGARRQVYLGARDETRGKAAVQRIQDSISGLSSGGSVVWLPLDLSTPQLTKAGADAFLRSEKRLDVLIHNASSQEIVGYSTVSEGGLTINKTMSTNYLGPFILTQELMPVLKRTAEEPNSDVRIVFVTSMIHLHVSGKPDFRNLEGWNARKGDGVGESLGRYGISKLAIILFTRELQSRLDADNIPITCITLHPGMVNTDGQKTAIKSGILSYLVPLITVVFGLAPLQGSYTTLFAATSQKIKAEPTKYKGSFLLPYNRVTETSAFGKDKQLAEDLWACSEEVAEICLRGYQSRPSQ
ncbi:hypothetical protein FRC04_009313 [Tulasnella sp. 424]|nr:hypothetical protein FRC04_009313 [Tulasnella sp. 424]